MHLGKQRIAIVGLSFLVVIFTLAGRLVGEDSRREQTYTDLATFTEVLHLVDTSYVDPVDEDSLMVGAFRGLLSSLDPHSGWLSPDEVEDYLDEDTVRIHSGIEATKRAGYAYVATVRNGSPAERAGVERGDYIRTIDGRSTREMSVLQVRHNLTGASGRSLELNLFGGHEGRNVKVSLAPYDSEPVSASTHPGGVLLLTVQYLDTTTVTAIQEILAQPPEGASQLLLDLRDTVGGGRSEGAALADLFLAEGTIVRLEERGQEPEDVAARPGTVWEGPLALLVNRLSAGAVEIAVAGLKEAGRARILGETTFGDAALQRLIRLPDQSAVVLTVGRYLDPQGRSWGGNGIEPDVTITARRAEASGPEGAAGAPDRPAADDEEDAQLEQALRYLSEGDAALKTAA
jgi:carboxyl-terminal processing protease